MTKKITFSLPDDVAERIAAEPNASAFVAGVVRSRMASERMRVILGGLGMEISDAAMEDAGRELEEAYAKITPELRREAEELAARVRSGRP